jgi:hypothetical protein
MGEDTLENFAAQYTVAEAVSSTIFIFIYFFSK